MVSYMDAADQAWRHRDASRGTGHRRELRGANRGQHPNNCQASPISNGLHYNME